MSIACRERRTSVSEVTERVASLFSRSVSVGRRWSSDPEADPGADPEAPITGYETNGADTRNVAAGCKTIVMRLYRDRAVVLRQHKLGEADRIVTLLTRDHGLVRAVARGVRRTRSKFGARLEPFAHIDVQLHPGRNLDIVTQIVSDYGRYTCGCAMLETAERLAGEERAPAPELHRLTVSALRAVADGRRPRDLLLDAYLLRAMGIAGWAPALTECARCATPGPHRAFHIAAGGSVCAHCRPAGSTTPPLGVLELMSALHDGDWEAAQEAPQSHRNHVSGLVAAHLQWHLERQLKTLPLVERTNQAYQVDRSVADRRAALIRQDMACG
jgi:DNA repair protein RecO (recombination protein O)